MKYSAKLSDWSKICDAMLSVKLPNTQKQCFYYIVPDVNTNRLTVNMTKTSKDIHALDLDKAKQKLLDQNGKRKQEIWIDEPSNDKRHLQLLCTNISHYTLLPNLFEIVSKLDLGVEDILVAQAISTGDQALESFFSININLLNPIDDTIFASLREDFQRYLQTRLKAMSIFDLVGPAMVGPSSSHTAGASRIGLLSRHIIEAVMISGEEVESIEVKLFASFRDTGVAHKTPHALGGGLSGYATDDPELLAHGDPDYLKHNGFTISGKKIEFLGYKKGSSEEEKKYASQQGNNIAEINFVTNKASHSITGFSIGGGNIEIRYFDGQLNTPLNGKRDMRLVDGKIVPPDGNNDKYPIIEKIFNDESNPNPGKLAFNTFEEMLRYVKGKNLIDVIVETEMLLQHTDRNAIYGKMGSYWTVMSRSVEDGLKSQELSLFKLSGQNASMLNDYVQSHNLFDNLFGRAIAYSVAVNEINAKSGLIVACPTAGSCGILPGVLKAYDEICHPSQKQLSEALMVAGFFGMILFDDVSTAGADYGCQAEIGAAAAMAAAALTYLEDGTSEQMVEAFTIAIKNVLGLICDPVAGLVEVPCVKRNGMYATQAISAAMMALSGVKSFISPDEVMLVMKEVGQRLHIDYKETSRAGLAKTRDGKAVEQAFAGEIKKFFG